MDRGASTVEYTALLLVLAAVVTGLIAVGLPGKVESAGKSAICKVFSEGDCGIQPRGGGTAKGPGANACQAFCPTADNPIHPSDPVTAATKGGYVAMGDSYSSGEGANDPLGLHGLTLKERQKYLDRSGRDGCHRAPAAYSQELQQDYTFQDGSNFVACSGATTVDMTNGMNGEPSQLGALNPRTTLVTLSAGGDDLHFSTVMQKCVLDAHTNSLFGSTDKCQKQRAKINSDMSYMFDSPPNPPRYQSFLESVHAKAPNARVMVVGYPHLFPEPPKKNYDTITKGDQNFLNQMDQKLNNRIKQAAQAADEKFYPPGKKQMGSIEYADNWNGLQGHEVTSHDPWINGIEICWGLGLNGDNPNCQSGKVAPDRGTGTFHPTAVGQKSFEQAVRKQLVTGPNRTIYDP